jgi:membrane protease YdiL (CAAX protease family)
MEIDLFLWPMLVPMILPFVYCMKFKRDALFEIGSITVVLMLIVVLYWPLLMSNFLLAYTYTGTKVLLFVFLPLVTFLLMKRNSSPLQGSLYGIEKKSMKNSMVWCLLFLPFMLIVTGLIQFFHGITWDADVVAGIISFFEAFTEEFLFRGILFIFLVQRTNMKIAYVTSLLSFILMHPQNLSTIFIVGTIVQGVLTLEIARRSHNIIGSWVLHGSNRFFTLVLLPLLM